MRLEGKVAIITGGARGIGRAIATAYAAEGARVVVADINATEVASVAAEIGHGAIGVGVDVTQQASIDAMVSTVVERAGRIDILVNNAGVFEMGSILEFPRESYAKQFAVNVEGLLFTLQAVARQMVEQGQGGKIINFASQAGRRGEALVAISITQSAGLELIKHGINVNGMAPGVVDTPMWDVVDAQFAKHFNLPIGEKKRQVGLAVPYGRMGHVEDMTGAAVFLASSDADYIVAQTLNVDGGNWMS
jgi:NAD(P)-dependent dehydrogenase (short-subunit alcohol dehydrogenase family)